MNTCKTCHDPYDPDAHVLSEYWNHPTNYRFAAHEECLGCWLGIPTHDDDIESPCPPPSPFAEKEKEGLGADEGPFTFSEEQ